MAEPVLAWHFLASDKKMAHRKQTVVKDGKTYRFQGQLALCKSGLHASILPLDAIKYAPGCVVCRVAMSGDILYGDDKLCATRRKVLWMADATHTLHSFACWCATQALERERSAGREPDQRLWAAIAAKEAWLRGEIDTATLIATAHAANVAASAATSAASGAASAAAYAAYAATYAADVAAAAADAAAASAAYAAYVAADTAYVTSRKQQCEELTRRLLLLAPAELDA